LILGDRPVLAVVGASGSGKTWLGTKLAPALGIPRLAIDDYGKPGSSRWPRLLAAVEEIDGKVLVESCAAPPIYRPLIGFTVLLRARPAVRQRRLRRRGESLAEARRLARDTQRTPKRGDITLRGELLASDVADLADRLADLGWSQDVGGNPQTGRTNTARPAEKKVYGLPNAGARG
jgi:hypothetical protein